MPTTSVPRGLLRPTSTRLLPPVLAAAVVSAGLALAPLTPPALAAPADAVDYTTFVDPFVSTEDDFGQNIPGAFVPSGLAKANPMTAPGRAHTGYDHAQSRISGFTHTGFDGTGGSGAGGDLLVVPTYADYAARPDTGSYAQDFSHDDETAEPGYYQVGLQTARGTIDAEMTADTRSAVERYTFPDAGTASLVLDLRNNFTNRIGSSLDVSRLDDGRAALSGHVIGFFNGNRYRLHYYAETSTPATSVRTWGDGSGLSTAKHRNGSDTGAVLGFDVEAGEPVELRVTLSPISVAQAERDQRAELGDRTFEQVRADAHEVWQQTLGRVAVSADDTSDPDGSLRTLFYTSLYRVLATPVNATSTDGTYRGVDGAVHRADGYTHYDGWGTWDDFRKYPVLAYLYPDVYDDVVQSLVDLFADDAAVGSPSLNSREHAVPTVRFERSAIVVADAVAKGVHLDRLAQAYPAIARNATTYDGDSEARGYLAGNPGDTVATAYDDYALSVIADAVGRGHDATTYRTRSANYRNSMRPGAWTAPDGTEVSVLSPRQPDGRWADADLERFEAARLYQGTLWQYTWYPAHDMAGLVEAMGGTGAARAALSHFFGEQAPDDGSRMLHSNANEIDLQTPYLFNYLGQPWKTQRWVRAIYTQETWQRYIATGSTGEWPSGGGELTPPRKVKAYQVSPQGFLPTMDDDGGTMSAMYVAAAVGLFPVTAGSSQYQVGSPFFDEVRIAHADGSSFTVRADGVSPDDYYIQSASLDGDPLGNTWLDYADVADGGSLDLTMGPEASTWGADGVPAFSSSDEVAGPVGGGDDALEWSSRAFTESADNDGTIGGSIEVRVHGAAYRGTVGDDLSGMVESSGVPGGLRLRAVKTGATTMTLSLTGTATRHRADDSVHDLTVHLRDALFTGGVSSPDKTVTLGVVYRGHTITSDTTRIEAGADGAVDGELTMRLRGGAAFAGSEGADMVAAGLVRVVGLPAGVSASVRRLDATRLQVRVTGTLPRLERTRFAVRLTDDALAEGVTAEEVTGTGLRLRDPYAIVVTDHWRSLLREQVDEARLIVAGNYAAATFDAVVTARDAARRVLADVEAGDAELNAAAAQLSAAVDGLTLGEGGYRRLEAEQSDVWSGGPELHNESINIGGVRPGAWIAFDGVTFDDGELPSALQVRYSGASDDGYDDAAVEAHVDAPDGPLVGTVAIPPTANGFGTYETVSADLSDARALSADGPRRVYFVFTGSSDDGRQHWVANVDWLQFADGAAAAEHPPLQPGNATGLHPGIDASNPALFQNLNEGEWADYDAYDFGDVVDTVTVYYDKPGTRTPEQTSVELHLDGRAGAPAATVPLATTGSGWGTYSTLTLPLDDPTLFTGVHDLSLVFRAPGADGDHPYVANVGYVQLSSSRGDGDGLVLEAESYDDKGGSTTLGVENSTWNDGTSVTNVKGTRDGDWLRYDDVDLASPVTSLAVHYVNNSSRCGTGSRIDVHLGSRESDAVASIPLPVTGSGWADAGTTGVSLPAAISGRDDVFLVLHTTEDSAHPYVANIDWVRFTYGVDKTGLRELHDDGAALLAEAERYVSADVRVLRSAMTGAVEVLDDDTATTSQVKAATRTLRLATGHLEPRARRLLGVRVADAEQVDLSGYTAQSAAVLREELETARAMLDAGTASDDAYTGEAARVEDAMAGLVAAPASAPQPPTAVSAVLRGRSLVVSWSPPTDDGGASVTGYRLRLDGGPPVVVDDPAAGTHTFTGLSRGRGHLVSVAAVNAVGVSRAAEVSAAVPAQQPGTPQRPAASTVGATVTVAWAVPDDGGSPITGYLVRLDDTAPVAVPAGVTGHTFTGHTFTGVPAGSHDVVVAAVNAAGRSEWSVRSNAVQVRAQRRVASASATAVSWSTARVGWTMRGEGDPVVVEVTLRSHGGVAARALAWSDQGPVVLGGLRPGRSYTVSVGVQGGGPVDGPVDGTATDTVRTPARPRVQGHAVQVRGPVRVGHRVGVQLHRHGWSGGTHFRFVWKVAGHRVGTGQHLRVRPAWSGKRLVVTVRGTKADWLAHKVRSQPVTVRR